MSIHQPSVSEAQSEFEDQLRRVYFKLAHLYSLLSNGDNITMASYNTANGPHQSVEDGSARFFRDMGNLLDALFPNDGRLLNLVASDKAFETSDGFNGVKDEIKAILKYASKLPQEVVNKLVEVLGATVFFEYMLGLSPDDEIENEPVVMGVRLPTSKSVLAELLREHNGFISPLVLEGLLTGMGAAEMETVDKGSDAVEA